MLIDVNYLGLLHTWHGEEEKKKQKKEIKKKDNPSVTDSVPERFICLKRFRCH